MNNMNNSTSEMPDTLDTLTVSDTPDIPDTPDAPDKHVKSTEYDGYYGYLFIIYSCKKNLENANMQYKYLLAKGLVGYKIFIIYGDDLGSSEFKISDKYLILNVADDYYSLNKKTIALLNVVNKLFPNIKGMLKCDDDIIPNINHLNNFISSEKIKTIEYCGYYLNNKDNHTYFFNYKPTMPTTLPIVQYCGGPLYYLSKKSINIFKNANDIIMHIAEDVMVGVTLNKFGIYPINNYPLYTDTFTDKSLSYHNSEHKSNITQLLHI